LQRFADSKCAEAEKLMARLLRHRGHEIAVWLEVAEARGFKECNQQLAAENKRLRADVSKVQRQLSELAIRHREAKAAQRTAELQELAKLRGEAEAHDIELYAFILSALSPYIYGSDTVDEESARRVVAKVGSMLRSRPSVR
jgi:regulator of replication initiation timing